MPESTQLAKEGETRKQSVIVLDDLIFYTGWAIDRLSQRRGIQGQEEYRQLRTRYMQALLYAKDTINLTNKQAILSMDPYEAVRQAEELITAYKKQGLYPTGRDEIIIKNLPFT